MRMTISGAKKFAGLLVMGAVVMGASPAFAGGAASYSPSGAAYSYTYGNNAWAADKQNRNGKSYAEFWRTGADSSYHLWNKGGPGTTAYSDSIPSMAIYKLRACDWVPDNDDDCAGYSYTG